MPQRLLLLLLLLGALLGLSQTHAVRVGTRTLTLVPSSLPLPPQAVLLEAPNGGKSPTSSSSAGTKSTTTTATTTATDSTEASEQEKPNTADTNPKDAKEDPANADLAKTVLENEENANKPGMDSIKRDLGYDESKDLRVEQMKKTAEVARKLPEEARVGVPSCLAFPYCHRIPTPMPMQLNPRKLPLPFQDPPGVDRPVPRHPPPPPIYFLRGQAAKDGFHDAAHPGEESSEESSESAESSTPRQTFQLTPAPSEDNCQCPRARKYAMLVALDKPCVTLLASMTHRCQEVCRNRVEYTSTCLLLDANDNDEGE